MRSLRTALTVLALTTLGACTVPPPGAGDATPQDLHHVSVAPATNAVNHPGKCKGYVALSFDDGPTPGSKPLVDAIKSLRIPVTFFNTGEHTRDLPDVIKAERSIPGVQFGNHSWDHPDLGKLPLTEVRDQIVRTQEVQGKDVTMFRPPYGSAPPNVQAEMVATHVLEVLWTKDSKDFEATSVEQIVRQSAGMNDGGILLLHDGHAMTVTALPLIVDHYYSRGLCIGRIAKSDKPQTPAESPALTFYAKAVAP